MSKLVLLSAPAALGFAAGLLTGLTGPDSTVVAAVLPVVLSAIGGALLVFKISPTLNASSAAAMLTSASVLLFSVFLVAGVYVALFIGVRAAYTESIKNRLSFAEAVEFRRAALERCSVNEFVVNNGRTHHPWPGSTPRGGVSRPHAPAISTRAPPHRLPSCAATGPVT